MTDLPRPVVAIPLRDAAMCLSCEAIFYLAGANRCPLCADEHFLMVQNVVGTIRNETAGAGTPATTQKGVDEWGL